MEGNRVIVLGISSWTFFGVIVVLRGWMEMERKVVFIVFSSKFGDF